MTLSPRLNYGLPTAILLLAIVLFALTVTRSAPVAAAPAAKDPEPGTCIHVATADSIKVYFCEEFDLFVNQLGFMVFEP